MMTLLFISTVVFTAIAKTQLAAVKTLLEISLFGFAAAAVLALISYIPNARSKFSVTSLASFASGRRASSRIQALIDESQLLLLAAARNINTIKRWLVFIAALLEVLSVICLFLATLRIL